MPTSFLTSGGLTLRADRFGDADAPAGRPAPRRRTDPPRLARDRRRVGPARTAARSPSICAATATATGRPTADYRLDAFASDVRDIAATFDAPPVLVGASLGGMASLLAISEEPRAAAAALVLVDVAHRFNENGTDKIMAFMQSAPDGFASPAEAAAAVAAYLPHRDVPADGSGLARNLRLVDGRWHWHWDPRMLGATGVAADRASGQMPGRMRAASEALEIPTLLVRGGVSEVLSAEIAQEFGGLVPHAEIVDVSGAHHMVAGDDNDSFTAAVSGFLAGVR